MIISRKITTLVALVFFVLGLAAGAKAQVLFDYNPPALGSSEVVKRNDLNAELDGINSAKQEADADLTCLAGLTSAADKLFYFTGSGACALVDFNSVARSLIDDTTTSAMRTTLGLAIGTDVQAFDSDLTTWAGVTSSANGRSLVSAADYAAMRALLDLEAGTDFYSKTAADAAFQPLDADLTTLAAGSWTDPNLDQLAWWDDSQGRFEFMTLTDMTTEASPATGDYIVLMDSGGGIKKADWSTLPSGGSGSPGGTAGQIQFNNSGSFGGFTMGGDVTVDTSTGTATIGANTVALGGDTTGNYAAGDAEAGAATTGDSATSFFSSGTLEAARLPAATDTAQGACELATTSETTTGTDTGRCVTPAGVAAAIAAGGSAAHVNIQTFTASGTYTPTAGLDHAVVICTGGGGASGAATSNPGIGGPGSGAATAIEEYSAATIGASQTVTIGAGGTAVSNASGNNGGDTTFGALMTAGGGVGGTVDSAAGQTGGTATGGDVNIPGGDSGASVLASGLLGTSGGSYWGPGLPMGIGTNIAAAAGTIYGQGARGGSTNGVSNVQGAAGAGGICVITEYY